MRLKEVHIERYGPIRSLTWRLPEGIQPIHGPNESGKTLVVEALLKMFAGKDPRTYSDAERVNEVPEGYIILERGRDEVTLEKGKTLSDLLRVEPEQLRNIFVVRDADLKVEEKFYEDATERLVGLRTEDIRTILSKLIEMGRLTPNLEISSATKYNKAGEQLKAAEELRDEIHRYIEAAERDQILRIEAELLESESEQKKLGRDIEIMSFAKSQETLEHANSRLEELNRISDDQISSFKHDLERVKSQEDRCAALGRSIRLYRWLIPLGFLGCIATFTTLVLAAPRVIALLPVPITLLLSSIAFLLLHHRANSKLSEIESSSRSTIRKGRELRLRGQTIMELESEIQKTIVSISRTRIELGQDIGVLKDSLGIRKESPEEILSEASHKLMERKKLLGISGSVTYSGAELEDSRKRLQQIDGKLQNLGQALESHKAKLHDFSKRADKLSFEVFLGKDLDLEIENLESLKQLLGHLEEFIRFIGTDAKLSSKAVEILREMESEEEERISKLFGKGSKISKIFRHVTCDRYVTVGYDHESRRIFVQPKSGQKLPAEKLSKGTRNQLYLAIRMALGRSLLEEPGFFILDEVLESSDEERLQKQLETVREISKMGWQVVFLTVNSETCEALSQLTANKPLELERIPLEVV